jgi:hypothetical protein
MKPIYWLMFGWFAPFWAFIVLYLKLWIMIITLLVRLFVWICQGLLALTEKAIEKVKNRKAKQLVTDGQVEQIEEAEL